MPPAVRATKSRAGAAGANDVHERHREILPDYARPTALMVPHCNAEVSDFLEAIAVAAAQETGVILLAVDPARAQQFAAGQVAPERFSVVGAQYDTPWIRDRAPIAVGTADGVEWVLPQMPDMVRDADDRLFGAIAARPVRSVPILVPQGNLVAGPDGLVLSTSRVLAENGFHDQTSLVPAAAELGIAEWLLFEPFPEEPTGHADVYVRFLRADLMAVAWHADEPTLVEIAEEIELRVRERRPAMRSLRIPCARVGGDYASLMNWVQLGDLILLPYFPITALADLDHAQRSLKAEGFRVFPLHAPTLKAGGSIHCLTASIFL